MPLWMQFSPQYELLYLYIKIIKKKILFKIKHVIDLLKSNRQQGPGELAVAPQQQQQQQTNVCW